MLSENLINNLPIGCLLADPDWHLINANPSFCQMTGLDSQNLKGKELSLEDILADRNNIPILREQLDECNKNEVEFEIKRGDGSIFPGLLMTGVIKNDNGSILAKYVTIKDISQERRLEEKYLQAQKMESLGLLAGGLAHDMNNIMQVIVYSTEAMLSKFPQKEPVRQHLLAIAKASERAISMNRQLLALARKQPFKITPLSIDQLLNELIKVIGRLLGEKIKIVSDIAQGLPSINGDRGQLEQVIMNLSVNARDAMIEGGVLTIKAEAKELDEMYSKYHPEVKPGKYVLLSISDTGIGMNAETKKNLFQPFFTTKEPGKGTGLGLSVVYGVVKQHGGSITVYSEPGKGTIFNIFLPTTGQDVKMEKGITTAKIYKGSETILLVEDEEQVREIEFQLLNSLGYKVLAAGDGPEAEEIFLTNHQTIELLVSDMVLPSSSGPELYKKMKETNPQLRALIVSGYLEASFRLPDESDFLQKPFSLSALSQKVRFAIDRKN